MNSRERIIAWDKFLKNIRIFLHERGYYEVQTDHLVPAGAFEASIDAIGTRGSFGQGELHTSPEIQMKQLIADSHLSIFQISRCFRDDPVTPVHRREFTMLEYYRIYGTYQALQTEICDLLEHLSGDDLVVKRQSVRELVELHTGIDLVRVQSPDDFFQASSRIAKIGAKKGDSWQDLFFKLWVSSVEPDLDPENPVLVYDYPAQVAALAAVHSDNPLFAQRFEIYWKGMELCNGAVELRDLQALDARYEAESKLREWEGKPPHPRPEILRQALQKGLPDCCGIAVGLDRVFAAIRGQRSLEG